MADYGNLSSASENIFAAWLDGTLTPEEDAAFMEQCAASQELRDILDANDQVDEYYEDMVEGGYELPEELSSDFDLPYIAGDADDANGDIYPYDEMEPYEDEDNDGGYGDADDDLAEGDDGYDGACQDFDMA